jgi:hypothetical protein
MTTLSWWPELDREGHIIDVGGFARLRFDPWEFDREARRRFPILAGLRMDMARAKLQEAWWVERIAPLLWLSMPVHDAAPPR